MKKSDAPLILNGSAAVILTVSSDIESLPVVVFLYLTLLVTIIAYGNLRKKEGIEEGEKNSKYFPENGDF